MRRMEKSCVCCLLLLLLVGCVREVELELPPVPPRLVLNASVTSGQDIGACLSKSWFLLDSMPDDGLSEGTISVYLNGQFRGMMQKMSEEKTDGLKGQYTLPGCHVNPGDWLLLKAKASDFDPVEGATLIPAGVDISSLDTARFISTDDNHYRQPYMRLYINFKDDPAMRNYYRLIVERLIEYRKGDSVRIVSSYNSGNYGSDPEYLPDFRLRYEDPVFQSVATNPTLEQLDANSCRGTFADNLFNGESYTVKSSFAPVTDSYKGDSVTTIVHYDIRLLAISTSYYHYLTVIRSFSVSFGEAFLDGLLEPSSTYSNVENGFGVVAGYQVAYKRITMPFGSEPPLWTPWSTVFSTP